MSVIGQAIADANKERVSKGFVKIRDYTEITLYDPYVYLDISKGKSFAVFQIESEGMRSFMKDLFSDVSRKIKKIEAKYGITGYGEFAIKQDAEYMQEMTDFGKELFERIVAGVSLYRPGPMDYIPDYIRGMNNPNSIVYDTPLLEDILKATYGVIVYQEQVMEIVRTLAGFTAGQSDTIRKAMGKKKQEILDEYKPYFIYGSGDAVDSHSGKPLGIKGCVNNGIPEDVAGRIWEKMADFAKYAFNKSHACAYSVITVDCAWLKYYYPCAFMTATLNVYIEDDKLRAYISATKGMNIPLHAPNINLSDEFFRTDGKEIIFGLKAIKGISKTVSEIVEERKKNGNFLYVTDFVSRTFPLGIKQANYEALVHAGCFDSFGYSRKALINCAEEMYERVKKLKAKSKKISEDQLSFFSEIGVDDKQISYEIENCEEFADRAKLKMEFDVAGIYISAHPLDSYHIDASEITSIVDDNGNVEEGKYTFAGLVSESRTFLTKKGDKMATFVLSDRGGSIKCTVFPKEFESAQAFLSGEDNLVVIKGDVKNDENYGVQIIVNSIIDIDNLPKNEGVKRVCVKIPEFGGIEAEELLGILKSHKGDVPIVVQTKDRLLNSPVTVNADSSLYMALSQKYGEVEYE